MNRKLTVSVSMIMRSTKFAVIISTWYFRSESSTNTVIITSDSAPATAGRRVSASQKKFRMPQAIKNAAISTGRASVASMMARAMMCGAAISASRR